MPDSSLDVKYLALDALGRVSLNDTLWFGRESGRDLTGLGGVPWLSGATLPILMFIGKSGPAHRI